MDPRWFRVHFDRVDVPQAVSRIDGEVVEANEAFCRLVGRTREQVVGQPGGALHHHSQHGSAHRTLSELALGKRDTARVELVLAHEDGRAVPVDAVATLLRDAGGTPQLVAAVLPDAPALPHPRRAGAQRPATQSGTPSSDAPQSDARSSEARYRAIADTAYEGIWLCAPDGATLYANARMAAILGVSLEELYAVPAPELLGPSDVQVGWRRSTRAEVGGERYEARYRHPDGSDRVLGVSASPLLDEQGRLEGTLAMVSDVTRSRRLEDQLRHSVLHDQLTGLPNRALLLDRLEHALERDGGGVAVLFIDLDHFKLLNDSRGHSVGDALLVAVAGRLRSLVRPGDTVARFGGDEFMVVCEGVSAAEAGVLADRWALALAEPILSDGQLKHTSASIGVALSGAGPIGAAAAGPAGASTAGSAADLVREAETAMYSAKGAGRRRVVVFSRELADRADERYALSGELRSALAADALQMHYQPVVDLTSGAVLGVEALARWSHPELGWIPPDRFVPVAEDTGMAPELDRWALRRAIGEAGAMRADGTLPGDAYVAVNLSAGNLSDVALETLVESSVRDAGLQPRDVVLEITESAVMASPELAVALLGRLRDRGFRVALDDFGTGYSSMAHLRRLPLTTLKIDRSFVAEIVDDPEALAIVASIVQLGHAIGVQVVAEGVETPGHARLLRELGCGAAQGWLWSAAVPPGTARVEGTLTRVYEAG